jgi:HK97 gp10 family phage protein
MKLSARAGFNASNLSGLVSKIASGAVDGVTKAGQQALAIEQRYTPVATGKLRDSETCEVTQDGTRVAANIGPRGVDYDVYVEYGTGRRGDPSVPHTDSREGMTPQPFARPMMDEMSGQVEGIVADAIKSVI